MRTFSQLPTAVRSDIITAMRDRRVDDAERILSEHDACWPVDEIDGVTLRLARPIWNTRAGSPARFPGWREMLSRVRPFADLNPRQMSHDEEVAHDRACGVLRALREPTPKGVDPRTHRRILATGLVRLFVDWSWSLDPSDVSIEVADIIRTHIERGDIPRTNHFPADAWCVDAAA